jgi:hypothetical protein
VEIVVVILAIWLVLLGLYGAWPYLAAINFGALTAARPQARPAVDLQERYNDQIAAAAAALAQPERPLPHRPAARASVPGLFSEVDMLRAQVEQLRSEIVALSSAPLRPDRPRLRRYSTGVYTYLPRPLRQHVREIRVNRRHPNFEV